MSSALKVRLLFASLTPLLFSCIHRHSVAKAPPARQEATFDCVAEVVDVKREVWKVRLSSHSYPDAVWQGAFIISLRFLSPAAHAGEVRSLGVYDEREIVVDGRTLAPGDTIRFVASDSVLQRSIVPEVFSNLRGVVRTKKRANKALEPTRPLVMPRALSRDLKMKHRTEARFLARVTPSGRVAHL